jgi:hypothetical protein
MKKIHFSLVLLVLLSLIVVGCGTSPSSQTPAVANPTLTIVNQTGVRIWYVQISPVTDDNWGDDWLAEDQELRNGQSETFTLRFPLSVQNKYDIRLMDPEYNKYTMYSVTIGSNDQLIFTAAEYESD